MLLLAARLRHAGVRCRLFGYVAAAEPFDRIAARLARWLQHSAGRYVAIGHSLGGLLLRAAIEALPPAACRPEHLFLLGTPNRSPRVARRLQRWWPYRFMHGDSGQMLAAPERMAALPRPAVPTTVIAGARGWRGRWSPFGAEENDGVVAVSEVAMDGLHLVRVPAVHTLLMNSRQVFDLIVGQLKHNAA